MKYDLVFEGGGAKGMIFVGAQQEFDARGHESGRLLGTSAGAITATLLAAGYSASEMLDALNERENGQPVFASFLGAPEPLDDALLQGSAIRKVLRELNIPLVPDFVEDRAEDWTVRALASSPRFRHLFSFVEQGGWYSARSFVTWLERKLDSGMFNNQTRAFSKMTLAEFHQATQRELTLVASDTTDARMLILNHRTAPDCPVVWAVRMSMSIPLLWQEVIWEAAWGNYRGKAMTGHAIVDGGLLSGFPIALFVSNDAATTAIMGARETGGVLGLLIDELAEVPNAPAPAATTGGFDLNQLRTAQRTRALINTMTQGHDNMTIETFAHLVVRLPAKGYGTTEFDMSDARRNALVNAGRQHMADYFNRPPTPGPGVSFATPGLTVDIADRAAARILAE